MVRGVVAADAVRSLADDDRRLVALRFGEGMTQREIAAELRMSQPMVHRRLRDLVRQLQGAVA